ncbi:helix-turn-helix domain-containing protein [Nitrosomonas sp. Nm33]|uniref:helix-turn-helix domain-containing protein n=1 Tax=Nitrosomonas sp. Nm33 TaxID=133724 RepID=UPI0030DBC736
MVAEDSTLEQDLKEGRKWAASVLYEEHPESFRALRLRAGYSQKQLAQKIGMSQPNICELESGKRKPSSDTLLRLAKALGTTTDIVLKSLNSHSE